MRPFSYSITIAHYNCPILLERMLSSIPNRDDIQIIVIDDCSEENVRKELQKLQHKNLEIIYNPKNCGAGYSRNIGLKYVTGRWLIAVDADDMFSTDAFDVLDKYVDSDYDYICYCISCLDSKTLLPNGQKQRSDNSVRAYLKTPNVKNTRLFKFLNTECWNKMVSVDFIRKNKIQWEPCRINVDVLYSYLIALRAKKSLAIPNELYHYVGNPNSITKKERSIEREFGFYLAAQKRNGFFKALGWGYPFYRYDILYIPFLLKKKGLKSTIDFWGYRLKHRKDVIEARKTFIPYLNGVDIDNL